MSIPRWVLISTGVTLMAVAAIAFAVLLFAGKEDSNPFVRLHGLMTKAEARAVVGPPDAVEVLRRAECW